jgi:hypothetical protein
MTQQRIGTEQIQLTGNSYVPTGNTLLHMTVQAQATFCCPSSKAETFSILNSTQQWNARVSVRSRRLPTKCFLPAAVFTFWPQDVLQTHDAQRFT